MQFHHNGYVTGDPRVEPAAGVGLDRPEELPDEVDALIVGAGPAGMTAFAQLAQFPHITTRLIERRPHRLEVGQADGLQARSIETFQAFGFANRLIEESHRIYSMAFWKPDPSNPEHIVRAALVPDDPAGTSEFPHLLLNQARVQDYFAEFAARSPARAVPDYGIEFLGLEVTGGGDHPVRVDVRHTTGPRQGEQRSIRAKYVVGCDGARSHVRQAIGRKLVGQSAMHAWGVIDLLAETDFPDFRTKCAIQSHDGGNILLIPREGGYLTRLYVDLGEVAEGDDGAVRQTPLDAIVRRANKILHPYSVEVRDVAWWTVYEVGHRLTDKFDDVHAPVGSRTPRVFIAGDACHTHSAKAGQGMNVSMQDGWNIGWKLGHVLDGRAPEALLDTYSAERQVIAQALIDFDKQWSTLMATPAEQLPDPTYLEEFYVKTFEFPAGFMTQYTTSTLIGGPENQHLATGFPIGKRFKSALVNRVCDTVPMHLGHHARADGRWRIYVFADGSVPGSGGPVDTLGDWLLNDVASPLTALTPAELDMSAYFDVKVVYQQRFADIDLNRVPEVFRPRTGRLRLVDREKVYATDEGHDIFSEREISRDGAIVVVRPDQYVANVFPLSATSDLAAFFAASHRAVARSLG